MDKKLYTKKYFELCSSISDTIGIDFTLDYHMFENVNEIINYIEENFPDDLNKGSFSLLELDVGLKILKSYMLE